DGLSGAYRAKTYTAGNTRAASEAERHFALADRFGLAGVVEVKLGLAWFRVLRGDFSGAQRKAEEAIALAPDQPQLRKNLEDIQHAAAPPAEQRFALAVMLAESGKLAEAAG